MIPAKSTVSRARTIKVIYFLAGVSNLLRINTSVQIIPIEILAVLAALFSLVVQQRMIIEKTELKILRFLNLFCIISLLNHLIIDIVYRVAYSETIKTCAQMLVFWSILRVAIIYMVHDYSRLIYFAAGYLVSISLHYFLDPTISMQADPWKFAFGPTITGLYFLLLKSKMSMVANTTFIGILVSIDVFLGSRSLALFSILAYVLTLKGQRIHKKSFAKMLFTLGMLIALLLCIERTYHYLSTSGALGQSQQSKALDQYGAGPIVFTARSEIAFEFAAIKSSPIFGLGSNPDITYKIFNETQKINQFLGVNTERTNAYKSTLVNGKIPQHSVLLGSWIEGGFIVFSFWMIIFLFALRKFMEIEKGSRPLGNFATYFGLSTIWHIILSPLGAGSRMEVAIGLIALLVQSKFGNDAIKN